MDAQKAPFIVQVWRLIESYQGESGMHVNEIRSTLKNLNINQIK